MTTKRILFAISLAAAAFCCYAQGSSDEPDERYRIELWLQGMRVEGRQEFRERGVAPGQPVGEAERQAVLKDLPVVQRNGAIPFRVFVTGPDAVRKEFTGSPKLRYETEGCLAIQLPGTLRATSTEPSCAGASLSAFVIVLLDGSKVVSDNLYFIQVD